MRFPLRDSIRWGWLARPVGAPLYTAHLIACAMICWGMGLLPGGFAVTKAGLAFLAVLYPYRVARVLGQRLLAGERQPANRRFRAAALAASVAVLLALATFWPAHLSLLLAKRDLNRLYFVEPMLDFPKGPMMIGPIYASQVDAEPWGLQIDIPGSGRIHYMPERERGQRLKIGTVESAIRAILLERLGIHLRPAR